MLLLLILLSCSQVQAKVYEAEWLGFRDDWHFVTKFCFAAEGGQSKATIYTSQDSLHYQAFHDGDNSWYDFDHQDCNASHGFATDHLLQANEKNFFWYKYSQQRPRWWFYTLANCEAEFVNITSIRIELTNPGGFFREQFSADQWGIPEMVIGFTVATLIIICLCLGIIFQHHLPTEQTNLLKGLMISSTLQMTGLIVGLVHIIMYAMDGIGFGFLVHIAVVFCVASHISFYFIGMMVARGYGVSESVTLTFDAKIYNGCILMFVVELVAYAYYTMAIPESTIIDPMQTWLGWLLCIVHILAFCYLAYCVYFHTLCFVVTDDAKRFYYQFIVLFGLWVFSLPLMMFITGIIAPHFRAKVVFGLEFTVLLCFEVGLVYLFSSTLPFRSSIETILQQPVLDQAEKYEISMTNLSSKSDGSGKDWMTAESP